MKKFLDDRQELFCANLMSQRIGVHPYIYKQFILIPLARVLAEFGTYLFVRRG